MHLRIKSFSIKHLQPQLFSPIGSFLILSQLRKISKKLSWPDLWLFCKEENFYDQLPHNTHPLDQKKDDNDDGIRTSYRVSSSSSMKPESLQKQVNNYTQSQLILMRNEREKDIDTTWSHPGVRSCSSRSTATKCIYKVDFQFNSCHKTFPSPPLSKCISN